MKLYDPVSVFSTYCRHKFLQYKKVENLLRIKNMKINIEDIYGSSIIKNYMISPDNYSGSYAAKYPATISKKNIIFNGYLVNFSLSLTFVLLMWLSANSFFYLPFTPVPITLQVFTVLFAAFSLGPGWAFITQIEYIILGIAGVPLFAGFKSGFAAIAGPSGGYILGFAVSSIAAGVVYKYFNRTTGGHIQATQHTRYSQHIHSEIPVFITALISLFIIYACGYIHLAGFLYNTAGKLSQESSVFINAFVLGILPFILFDMLKIMGVVALRKLTLLKR